MINNQKKYIGLGGAHASKYGLHIGHYFGSIIPIIKEWKNLEYAYFLIDDSNGDDYSTYELITKQIYSINVLFNVNIRIVKQSQLLPEHGNILYRISKNCNLNKIVKYNPHRILIKNNPHLLTIDDFIFPLRTSINILILNADLMFFSGNDYYLVKSCRDIVKKYSEITGRFFPLPKLYYQFGETIKGYNYKKMGVRNNNCIYLSDNEDIIQTKINKLFDYKYIFAYDTKFKQTYVSNHREFVFPITFLPFDISMKLGFDFIDETYLHSYKQKDLRENLIYSLENLTLSISTTMKSLSKEFFHHQIHTDNQYFENLINNVKINSYE